jgi:alpha-ketoglutarate-dependent taurine dioxygenase
MSGGLPTGPLGGPGGARRQATPLAPTRLVTITRPVAPARLPLVIEAQLADLSLPAWAAEHRDLIERGLDELGAVLFRGFIAPSADAFRAFMAAVSDAPMAYRYGSTPRREVAEGIYTSTDYPAGETIPLHNEMAYAREWPGRIAFCCRVPAVRGGETPICDSRAVLAAIPAATRARFAAHGVMYVRHYRPGVDVPWQQVFGTDDRDAVGAYCRAHEIAHDWRDDGTLVTRQVCQALLAHPRTGAQVWFNQAHLFHVSALAPRVRAALLDRYGEAGLPRNACLGDGAPLRDDDLAAIRAAYAQACVRFDWRRGDVLLLDNVLAAHGRQPFEGPREVVVAMADPRP